MERKDELRIILSRQADPVAREALHKGIQAYNDLFSEPHRTVRETSLQPLDIAIRDGQERLVGGLVGDTYWGWLEIQDLWLEDNLRRQGLGRRLVAMAEAEAVARGCSRSWLRTFSFQARGFYEKLGYRVVGQLDDYPPGQAFYWMRKDLSSEERAPE